MAAKVTPLYAETRILLNLFTLGEDKFSPSSFLPKGDKYKQALANLVEDSCLSETLKGKRYKKYSLLPQGKNRLVENLKNKEFSFIANLGPKTTNGLLKVLRELNYSDDNLAAQSSFQNNRKDSALSYKEFSEFVINFCQRINSEDNLDGLIPIYRVRREMGEVIEREQFDNWLFELQADNSLQMMGDDLSDTPQDQKDDSVQIPGGNLRFYIKLL